MHAEKKSNADADNIKTISENFAELSSQEVDHFLSTSLKILIGVLANLSSKKKSWKNIWQFYTLMTLRSIFSIFSKFRKIAPFRKTQNFSTEVFQWRLPFHAQISHVFSILKKKPFFLQQKSPILVSFGKMSLFHYQSGANML